ncbi:hypothetical protein LSG23_20465 (plasmid) [Bacillus velezensis]|uniref:hypothetical protein n=1 Tax=Bacillus velezensis TaxID=492670 RepID=UPI000988133F|nr:hypothetical protein [Bacillus velezensis]AQS42420.1 hypothetical protein BVH55_00040 [Bacillus velezensis]WNR83218.1 hypothetical protein RP314_20375 [Bacillus velezensis]
MELSSNVEKTGLVILLLLFLATVVSIGNHLYEDNKFENHATVINGIVKDKKVTEHQEPTMGYSFILGSAVMGLETDVDYILTVSVDKTQYAIKTDASNFNKLEVGQAVTLKKYNDEIKLSR